MFEAKVKFTRIDEATGKGKKVNIPYLIDAFSLTEVDARLTKEMTERVTGDFEIHQAITVNYSDIFFHDDGDKWYKGKIEYIALDEEAGKEKKTINYILVMADNLEQARGRITEGLSNLMVDYDITGVNETKIEEVFMHNAQ